MDCNVSNKNITGVSLILPLATIEEDIDESLEDDIDENGE